MLGEKEFKAIKESILSPSEKVRIFLPEQTFRSKYLPLFLDPERKEEFIKAWLKVCINPYYPVEVVDENKETIFIVPPLWIRQETKSDDKTANAFSMVLKKVQVRSEVIPKQGEELFNQCLPHLLPDYKKDYIEGWKTILDYYKIASNRKESKKEKEVNFDFKDF